jgi:hypothetical protein
MRSESHETGGSMSLCWRKIGTIPFLREYVEVICYSLSTADIRQSAWHFR